MATRFARSLLAAVLVAALAPAAALAGGPGKWTLISPNDLDNIDQVALARTPDGVVHAIYALKHEQAISHTAISPTGALGATSVVQQGWASITATPDIVTQADGSLRAFFGGIRTTDVNEPNSNYSTATAPASGDAWTLTPGNIIKGDAAYGSDTGVALEGDGTPLISWGGTGSGTFVHRGFDPGTPNFKIASPSGGCCTYQPDIAIDQNGTAYVTFFSNATGDDGTWIQELDPATGAPTGAPGHVPGSSTLFNGRQQSVGGLTRSQIAARVGGGVWVAGSAGYPTANKPFAWKIGTPKQIPLGVATGGDAITAIAADPVGRIWVFWVARNTGRPRLFARRSSAKNPAKFGPFVSMAGPKGLDSIFSVEGNAQAGRLDVIGLFGNVAGVGHWHTQIEPGLSIAASPTKINGNKGSAVKFTITDPDPVKGAKVSGGGKSGTTDKNGHVTLDIGPTGKKSLTFTVSHSGYTSAKRKLKVKR